MDTIDQVRWHPYRIPLKRAFTTAHGNMTVREGAIVEIITTGGIIGIGEIAPLPAFGGESLAATLAAMPTLAEHLRGRTLVEALYIVDASAICGLEIALFDALGQSMGCGVSALLASDSAQPRPGVWVNAVVGANATEAAVAGAKSVAARGFRCVKLKVGLGQDISCEIERIAAVRAAIGPGVHLRLDANEAWSLQQAITFLSRCVPLDIQYVEQPLPAADLNALRVLRQAAIVPIAIDESLAHLEDAYRILDSEAADILIIKPQVLGGLQVSVQLIRDAAERGIRSVVTSAIEAGIGLVAALHLAAALPGLTLECGLATLDMLEDDLLIDDLPIREGFLAVPVGSGLGVQLDRAALERYMWSI